jgi:DNA-binding helix-hairpin-helix protein with protein kinase domain
MNAPKSVVDTNGTKYVLSKQLGTGGQGAVFEVEGGMYAVKLLTRSAGVDTRRIDRQFMFLKQLDVGDVPIAKPVSVLRQPHAGYVMRLLKDMTPISKITLPPRGGDSARKWYRESGSLKRRLSCLASAGEAIAALHARGLCYGDVSPANIFIPTAAKRDEAWLIDSDNLRFDSNTSSQQFYTPGFGAPEVIGGTGTTTTLSDAHSFAVLSFLTLAQCHPLIGDMVHDGEPELEERAYEGKLPWIDHPADASNRSSHGIARSIVLSKGLNELAARAFESGLLNKGKRPSASEWAEGLRRAAAHCLLCGACGGSYYRDSKECPWCGKPQSSFLYAKVHTFLSASRNFLNGPDKNPRVEDSFVLSDGDFTTVLATTAFGQSAAYRRIPILRLMSDGSFLTIERISADAYIEIRTSSKRGRLGSDPLQVPIDGSLSKLGIHFGPESSDHRVLDLSHQPGGRR